MGEPTPVDRFWARAQLDLAELPRPWHVLVRLPYGDPLLIRLCRGESYMLEPNRTLEELEIAWARWLELFRVAIARVAVGSGLKTCVPPNEEGP